MYTLKIGDKLFYKYGVADLVLSNIKVNLELNTAGLLDFEIPPSHPFYNKLDTLTTFIDLYHDNEWIWGFRIVNTATDFNNVKRVECEGYLSFLTDSIQEPFEYQGDIKPLLELFLRNHNASVEKDKRIEVGNVTVYNSTNYINRSSGHRLGTLEAISTRLVETLDGYLHVIKNEDGLYLDYISVYQNSSQIIRFGENMLSLDNFLRGETIKTVVVPLGEPLEDEEGINDVTPRLTIESVNDGKNYLVNEDAVKKYGYIWSVIEFDDITLPENLKQRGLDYLSQVGDLEVSLEMGAIDLTMLGVDTETFKLGQSIRAVSQPHNLDAFLQLSAMELYLDDPSRNTYALGTALPSFSSNQISKERELDRTLMDLDPHMRSLIDNATELITGGSGGYIYTARNDKGHPAETFYMDTDNIATSKNILRINQNGLGFSNNGINGPYRNAWTIDGRLIADFIAAGTIRGVRLEGNQIIGGSVESEGNEGVHERPYVKLEGGVLSFRRRTGGRIITLVAADAYIADLDEPALGALSLSSHFSIAGYLKTAYSISSGTRVVAPVVRARQFVTESDISRKENIKDIDVSFIDELRVVVYDYKSGIKDSIGLIAQDYIGKDYNKYFLVEFEGEYGINYQTISNALIKYCQQLKKRLDEQEERIDKQEERINRLERLVPKWRT